MCTISWQFNSSGYSIFFNRDEQKIRPKAIPPNIYRSESADYIAAIDPQGGGSWLTVNNSGVTLALLNFYQGRLPKGRLTSRGKLVTSLIRHSRVTDVADGVKALDLNRYAPFSLLAFSQQDLTVQLLRWSGKELLTLEQESPLLSSAVKFEEVSKERLSCYKKHFSTEGAGEKGLLDFHRSHEPSASPFSVCMHRDEAETLSLSRVVVCKDKVNYDYYDGAPCKTTCTHRLSMGLNTAKT